MIFIFMAAIFIFASAIAQSARAEYESDVNTIFWGGEQDKVDTALDLEKDKDPREIAAEIINISLGFLGIIAVIIVLFGGFKWMTAMGNDEGIGEAKKLIAAGVIGLAIILSAYAISQFVLREIYGATK